MGAESEADDLAGGQVNILLVDDNAANLLALEATLSPLRYNLLRASSGQEALAVVRATDLALILLDVQMPEMDGFETARRIKELPRGRDVPIIFVTAVHYEEPSVSRGYELGAVDYVGKPFNPVALKAKVTVYADRQQLRRRIEALEKRVQSLEASSQHRSFIAQLE